MRSVLAVKPVLNVFAHIDLVNHLVGVLLQRRSENHDLVVLRTRLDEVHAPWSHEEEAVILILHVMDQSLIQIKHQGVHRPVRRRQRSEERRRDLGQILEIVGELRLRLGGDGRCLKNRKWVLACEGATCAAEHLACALAFGDAASRFSPGAVNGSQLGRLGAADAWSLSFGALELWQERGVSLELLYVVESVADLFHGDFGELAHPEADFLEDLFVLIGLADVADDVLTVGAVDAQHLGRILLGLELLKDLGFHDFVEFALPSTVVFIGDASKCDRNHNQELLVDVEHQILQVGVHASLCVDSGLFVGEKVIKLDNSDRDCLKFLRFDHLILQHGVFYD